MRSIVLTTLLALVTCEVASAQPATPAGQAAVARSAGRVDIVAAGNKFSAAMCGGDPAVLVAMYTPTARLFPPELPSVLTGDHLRDFWKDAAGQPCKATQRAELIEVYGDSAVDVGTFRVAGSDGKMMYSGKYMVLWKRQGGVWKKHRDIWNVDK